MADTPEMVERGAIRLFWRSEHLDENDAPNDASWSHYQDPRITLSEHKRQFWRHLMIEAIAAMLEPTKTMLNKGEYVNSEWLNDGAPIGQAMYREPAKSVYRAMIDAALKE